MLTDLVCKMLTPGNGLPCKHYIRSNEPGEPGFCTQGARFFCEEAMKRRFPSVSDFDAMDFIHCKLRYRHAVIEGLRVKPEHLPEAIKLGKAWKLIMRSKYENE